MDYGEAIDVLERSNEKFEFPVNWGVDLQSEHERYLTEKYAKKPVIVINYPKAIKAFCVRLNEDGRTVAAMDVLAPGDRRDHRRQPARGAARRIGPQHGRARIDEEH
jgi:asparaginyl-tRNA synthetase